MKLTKTKIIIGLLATNAIAAAVALSWLPYENAEIGTRAIDGSFIGIEIVGHASPGLSTTDTGRIYYDTVSDTLQFSSNGGGWSTFGAGTVTGTGAATQVSFFSSGSAVTSAAGLTFSTAAGLVVNDDSSATQDFRAETDTDVNGIFLDASAETLTLVGGSGSTGCTIDASGNFACTGTGSFSGAVTASGAANQMAYFTAATTLASEAAMAYAPATNVFTKAAGTLVDTVPHVTWTGTFPAVLSAANYAEYHEYTGAGNSSQRIIGGYFGLVAGYTGSFGSATIRGDNATAGTGVGWLADSSNNGNSATGSGNAGMYGVSFAATAGHNFGLVGAARGSTAYNYGVAGTATSSNTGNNIGVAGMATSSSTGSDVGGYFTLGNTTPANAYAPTLTDVALLVDNQDTAAAIAIFRDNGTSVFSVADGGDVSSTATITALGGDAAATPNFTVEAGEGVWDCGTNCLGIAAGAADIAEANATEFVVNEGGSATVDFRAETDTNASGIFLDASAETIDFVGGAGSTGCSIDASGNLTCAGSIGGSVSGGTSTQIAYFTGATTLGNEAAFKYDASKNMMTIASGTLAGGDNTMLITGTFNATPSGNRSGLDIGITTAGASSLSETALTVHADAGYTGTSVIYGAQIYTAATTGASTSTPWAGVDIADGVIGAQGAAYGSWAGSNYGLSGYCAAGAFCIGTRGVIVATSRQDSVSMGVIGTATVAANGGSTTEAHLGVVGLAVNGNIQIGGYFGLQATAPTLVASALLADNGAVAAPIFIARDNGTAVSTISDGGNWINTGYQMTKSGTATAVAGDCDAAAEAGRMYIETDTNIVSFCNGTAWKSITFL